VETHALSVPEEVMAKPTEQAQKYFDYAVQSAKLSSQFLEKQNATAGEKQLGDYNQTVALALIAKGLSELAIGLRATFILLEEVRMRL
jgi:hypothetical protein